MSEKCSSRSGLALLCQRTKPGQDRCALLKISSLISMLYTKAEHVSEFSCNLRVNYCELYNVGPRPAIAASRCEFRAGRPLWNEPCQNQNGTLAERVSFLVSSLPSCVLQPRLSLRDPANKLSRFGHGALSVSDIGPDARSHPLAYGSHHLAPASLSTIPIWFIGHGRFVRSVASMVKHETSRPRSAAVKAEAGNRRSA